MFFRGFHEYFPHVAGAETRSVYVDGHDEVGLVESYCTQPGCDCRRVIFQILARHAGEVVARVSYGWEPVEFYRDWGSAPKTWEDAEAMKGPTITWLHPSADEGAIALAVQSALTPDYVERLRRHYAMFRREVDKNGRGLPLDPAEVAEKIAARKRRRERARDRRRGKGRGR